jgi:PAS domain S-box-containing protein
VSGAAARREDGDAGTSAATDPAGVEALERVVDEQRRAEARLRERLFEHGLIDQAVGILAERLHCDVREAFEQLLEIERRSGRALLEVAAELAGRGAEGSEAAPAGRLPAGAARIRRLDRSADADELARLLVSDILAPSGAATAAIALLHPDGALELAGSFGLPQRTVSQWQRIPPQVDCLLTAAVRERAPVWSDPSAEAGAAARSGVRQPALPRVSATTGGVHVAVPLRLGRGLIGAAEIGWPADTPVPAEQHGGIESLVGSASHAVARTRAVTGPREGGAQESEPGSAAQGKGLAALLHDDLTLLRDAVNVAWEPMLLARVGGDPGAPDRGLVVEAVNSSALDLLVTGSSGRDLIGRRLAEAMPWAVRSGLFDALSTVLRTGTPMRRPAHYYAVGEAGPENRARAVGVGAAPLGESVLLITLRPEDDTPARRDREARLHRMTGVGPWEWDPAAGTVFWSAEALAILGAGATPRIAPDSQPPYTVHRDDEESRDRFLRGLAAGRAGRAEFRMLHQDGTVRHVRFSGEPVAGESGRAALVFGSVQDVTERRRAETALEIAQVQLAARRSRAESERQLANLLQQIIMPVEPESVPRAAGLEIAARYRPASASVGVGGDWYGVFPLPDARLLLTVGDIAGHGFPAATAMARLYHAVHGLALTGRDSGQLLRWLNQVTCALPEFTIASACCAIYDPADRRLSLANAGHPSPVLVRGGEAHELPRPSGGVLGVDPDDEYGEETVVLEPGDVLLLYTDGLVERRRHSPEENTASLLHEAARPPADLDAYVDRILRRVRSDTDDDTCLLAVRFTA